jgi:hypothetical protein
MIILPNEPWYSGEGTFLAQWEYQPPSSAAGPRTTMSGRPLARRRLEALTVGGRRRPRRRRPRPEEPIDLRIAVVLHLTRQ